MQPRKLHCFLRQSFRFDLTPSFLSFFRDEGMKELSPLLRYAAQIMNYLSNYSVFETFLEIQKSVVCSQQGTVS